MTADPRKIVLSGPPGVGKTTLAKLLSERLHVPFIDLDTAIADNEGGPVSHILSTRGEQAFRTLERVTLERLLESDGPLILSLGGGSLLDPNVRELVLRRTLVIGLVASAAALASRVRQTPGTRPLLGDSPDEHRLAELLRIRREAYATAHLQIRTDQSDAASLADSLSAQLTHGVFPLTISRDVAYSTVFAPDAHASAARELVDALEPSRVVIVTDETVAALHLSPFRAALDTSRCPVDECVVAPGEGSKSLRTAELLLERFLRLGLDRRSLLIAFGGGVVSDLTGFVASLFNRGIRWLAVPTTTLSMADAALGGKTAVNLAGAKNIVGSFHHPIRVIVDPSLTRTETDRARRSGLAEVVKTALLHSEAALVELEARAEALLGGDADSFTSALRMAVAFKTRAVESDPLERSTRVFLNLGHTVGHALEAASLALGNDAALTHGEAVAMGLVRALELGQQLGLTSVGASERVADLLTRLGLRTRPDPTVAGAASQFLAADKKRAGTSIPFVVLRGWGQPTTVDIPLAALENALLKTE
ncbi:MAG: bifunctional shikimate kinase/3-dehydroquinate synthase [Polyangiaceae bacterium]